MISYMATNHSSKGSATMTIEQQIQALNVGSEREIEGVVVGRVASRLWRVDGSTYARPSTATLAVVEGVKAWPL
jgi:hypothetical protein